VDRYGCRFLRQHPRRNRQSPRRRIQPDNGSVRRRCWLGEYEHHRSRRRVLRWDR
jgi:hypothetical protein